jgi:hypothetical protein
MADPRLAVGFEEIGAEFASFKIDNSTIVYAAASDGGSASVGLAVTLSAADTVALVADAGAVIGKLIKVESDNIATVQVKGGMKLASGTGAALTVGKAIVGCLLVAAKGYIREVNTAAAAQLGVCRGFIVDGGTVTAVEVIL